MGCGAWLAGCEMLSLILRTSNLSIGPLFCSTCYDSSTQNCFSHALLCYTSRTNPHPTPAHHALQPVNYTLQNR